MSFTYRSGHLSDTVDHYVDGTLDAESARCAARHLLVCAPCRRQVDAERAIVREVRAVRVDPERHASLVAGLIALAPASEHSDGFLPTVDGATRVDVERGASAEPTGRVRAAWSGRRVRLAMTMTLGAAAALALVVAPGARPHPAPRIAQTARTTQGRESGPHAAVVGLRTGGEDDVMRANRGPSGRMNP